MTDVFRSTYRALDPKEQQHVLRIKELAAKLHDEINEIHFRDGMRDLAKIRLEESVMWAVKGITG